MSMHNASSKFESKEILSNTISDPYQVRNQHAAAGGHGPILIKSFDDILGQKIIGRIRLKYQCKWPYFFSTDQTHVI